MQELPDLEKHSSVSMCLSQSHLDLRPLELCKLKHKKTYTMFHVGSIKDHTLQKNLCLAVKQIP